MAPIDTQECYENKFVQLIKNKTVHFLALFVMVYAGVEVTIRGIVFTYVVAQLGLI